MLNRTLRQSTRLVQLLVLSIPLVCLAEDDRSLFNRLVTGLEQNPGPETARFVSLALEQLSDAYLAEARITRQASDKSAPPNLSWRRAVEDYAAEFTRVRQMVEAGAPVRINAMPMTALTATVGDYRFMVTHPRLELQEAFETNLVETFCRQVDCGSILQEPVADNGGDTPRSSPSHARPRWEFTAEGPACMNQGLRLRFNLGTEINLVRAFCTDFFREVTALFDTLQWHRQHRVPINWSALSLDPVQSGHLLKINTFGDTATITAPLIYRTPGLLRTLSPWLQARLEGGERGLEIRARQDHVNGDNFELLVDAQNPSER